MPEPIATPATTEQVLDLARQLGRLIAQHPAAAALDAATQTLEQDTDAQRAANDLNRHTQTLSEKQAAGKPIEVEDKRKLETLQKAVTTSPILGQLQLAQMDYLDLMRRVDQAISGDTPRPA
ncbi:MAG: YlbF family regulator [Planctomycetota bacterium]